MATSGPFIHKCLLADERVWNRELIDSSRFRGWDVYFWLVRCSITASVSAERYAEFSSQQEHITNYDGRPQGVLLMNYAATLRQHPNYNIISGVFLNYLDGTTNEKEAKSNCQGLLKAYFIPNGADEASDDRIMMILLMGIDLVSFALAQNQPVKRAYHLYLWVYGTLSVPEKGPILAERLTKWMKNYNELIDPSRRLDVIKPELRLPTQIKIVPPQVSFHMRGSVCPIRGTSTDIQRPDWHILDLRVSEEDPSVQPSNCDVVRSYIGSRLPDGTAAQVLGDCDCTKISKQRLGVAMADYGAVLSQTEDYLQAFSRCVTLLDQSGFPAATFKDIVESCFLSNNQFILFDHIMTVVHLASDLTNYFIGERNQIVEASEIAQGAIAKLSCETTRAGAIMKKGWGELADKKLILTRRNKFNILGNLNFIGRPAEKKCTVAVVYGGKSIDVEHQTEPIIDIIEYKQLRQLNPALLQGSQSSFCDTVFLNMAIRPLPVTRPQQQTGKTGERSCKRKISFSP